MAKYHAPALDKGLDILEFLSARVASQSQQEIAKGINRSPNEIYRMLICLEDRGYITKDKISGKYQLSLRLFQIAHRHSPVDALLSVSKSKLELLASRIGQSCHISVLYQNQLMIVAQARNPGPVSLSVEIGGIFPLFQTTSGKIFLAFMPEKDRNELTRASSYYQKLSKQKKKSFDDYLIQINEDKYLVQKSDLTKGVTDIAAPIGSKSSGIVAVLAASCLTTQIGRPPVLIETIIHEIQAKSNEIMLSLGIADL